MDNRNEGLTVGELTIAIATILIISLTWSGLSKRDESKKSLASIRTYPSSMNSKISIL